MTKNYDFETLLAYYKSIEERPDKALEKNMTILKMYRLKNPETGRKMEQKDLKKFITGTDDVSSREYKRANAAVLRAVVYIGELFLRKEAAIFYSYIERKIMALEGIKKLGEVCYRIRKEEGIKVETQIIEQAVREIMSVKGFDYEEDYSGSRKNSILSTKSQTAVIEKIKSIINTELVK